ncbi:MAG: hypothetical protein WBD82_06070 [Acidimicrobiales bacterium]
MKPGEVIRSRALARCGASFVVAALIFVTGISNSGASSHQSASTKPIATTELNPNSICGSDFGDNVRQQWNGDYTGCFRVPPFKTSSAIVALQGFVQGPSSSSPEPTTTLKGTISHVTVKLTSSVTTVTPGENVVISGRLNKALTPKQSNATLCWDGCAGLQEQGQTLRWLSAKRFQVTLQVPETAWLVASKHGVSVHPLSSGTYKVGLQCLTQIFGCDLRKPEATVTVHLKAPTPTRCVNGKLCETMTIAPKIATVGDEVLVSGWAPLQTVIGTPWGYALSVTPGPAKNSYPPFAYGPIEKLSGSFTVVLAPTALNIGQSPPWASLGTIPYVSSTFSGPSAVSPSTNSSRVAWCQPSGIVITGGTSPVQVSTLGVRSALRGTTLEIAPPPSTPIPLCSAVQLDPNYADSIYGGFDSDEGNIIPPEYLAPMYSTNLGASWHAVPIPPGVTIEDFAGFSVSGSRVEALFMSQQAYSNSPVGTNHGLVTAEVTSNGGSTWAPTTLGCPANGPCMTFGPYIWGYCNMSNDTQGLLLGAPGSVGASDVKWTGSTWVTSVNSCFSQQLVVSSSHELFLLDPSSEYPLLRSTDGGETWTNWLLPAIPGANYGPDSDPRTNSLVLAPDGSLFASISTPNNEYQELFRLYPDAKSWCQIPHAFGSTPPDTMEPIHVDAIDLLWSQSSPFHALAVSYADLTC